MATNDQYGKPIVNPKIGIISGPIMPIAEPVGYGVNNSGQQIGVTPDGNPVYAPTPGNVLGYTQKRINIGRVNMTTAYNAFPLNIRGNMLWFSYVGGDITLARLYCQLQFQDTTLSDRFTITPGWAISGIPFINVVVTQHPDNTSTATNGEFLSLTDFPTDRVGF